MNKSLNRIYNYAMTFAGIAVSLYAAVYGYAYYALPLEYRPDHPLHQLLKPSGTIGHGYGIIGTLFMTLGVISYMSRKRLRFMFGWGQLRSWLTFHIFLCSVGPALILFHTAFKFGGIVSVSFWSMTAVVLSGVVGRFIYLQIPHSFEGNELSRQEIESLNDEISSRIRQSTGMTTALYTRIENIVSTEMKRYDNRKFGEALSLLISDMFTMRGTLRKIAGELSIEGAQNEETKRLVMPYIKEKLLLSRRIGMLQTMQRLFRYWHVFHLPFAITMFIILIVHVAIALYLGYHWLF